MIHDDKLISEAMAGHTPTPFTMEESRSKPGHYVIRGEIIPGCSDGIGFVFKKEDAAFIVRACNAYDEILDTLKGAAAAIGEEFCSHTGKCGMDVNTCSAQEYYKIIAKAEGK